MNERNELFEQLEEMVARWEAMQTETATTAEAETAEAEEAEAVEMVSCHYCGQCLPIDKMLDVNGVFVCEDCEEDNVVVCNGCGDYVLIDDTAYINGRHYCEDCVDELFTICECCGEYISARYHYHDVNGNDICESCRYEHYSTCYDCDELFHHDDLIWDEYEEEHFCEQCYNRRQSRVIKDYHFKPLPIFYGRIPKEEKRDSTLYMGVELEIDKGGEDHEKAKVLLNIMNEEKEHIYIKHDGSIDYGFEIVSHPMTMEYHKNSASWSALMEKAIEMGYRSHETETCGLHVHVSRNSLGDTYGQQEDTIARIIYFIEKNWRNVLTFTRRSERNLERWARRYGVLADVEDTYKNVKKCGCNRYMCVNLLNDNTIEFRMFRGTLKHETFLATLEFVEALCTMCKGVEMEEMEAITWTDFLNNIPPKKYPELVSYLTEKNLYN